MSERACKSCGYSKIENFLDLGDMPLANAFITPEKINEEKKYPLNLSYCPNCFLVQLEKTVPPVELFRNYLHLSSGSQANVKHLENVAEMLREKFNVKRETKILEIGSNDGTLLSFLKKLTPNVVGVDPAINLKKINEEKGIEYYADFFDTTLASRILDKKGKFDLIVALNVIPHTLNNIDLLKGVRILLNDSGTLLMEGVYALETILKGEFDTIYHEHIYTFSLHSLINTFMMAGLKIIDVEKIPTQGGSLRVFSVKNESEKPVSQRVKYILNEEKDKGLHLKETYTKVKEKVESFRKQLKEIIKKEKSSGKKIIGLGAPARGMVIINYCELTNKDISYLVDDTPLKHNKLSPGKHIPVKSFDHILNENDPVFFLLSWNYKESFVERIKKLFPKFRMIIPFPKLEVLDYE